LENKSGISDSQKFVRFFSKYLIKNSEIYPQKVPILVGVTDR